MMVTTLNDLYKLCCTRFTEHYFSEGVDNISPIYVDFKLEKLYLEDTGGWLERHSGLRTYREELSQHVGKRTLCKVNHSAYHKFCFVVRGGASIGPYFALKKLSNDTTNLEGS